ncbi:hypothetical protein NDU88_006684 [Pleurodeles waltl]|uniref:Uncharacterized protein n=1 Tax=Pleurodeles waltl TaxID=8319 RepID=A0AAV7RQV8_PLEWA|nr:hypothetical protein NDU88_006684 [Pleurodeles waltl]
MRRTKRTCGPHRSFWEPVAGPDGARWALVRNGRALAAFALILTASEWQRIGGGETLDQAARALVWGRPSAFRQAGPAFPVILGIRASEGYVDACMTS